jgi:hypothetical protein
MMLSNRSSSLLLRSCNHPLGLIKPLIFQPRLQRKLIWTEYQNTSTQRFFTNVHPWKTRFVRRYSNGPPKSLLERARSRKDPKQTQEIIPVPSTTTYEVPIVEYTQPPLYDATNSQNLALEPIGRLFSAPEVFTFREIEWYDIEILDSRKKLT